MTRLLPHIHWRSLYTISPFLILLLLFINNAVEAYASEGGDYCEDHNANECYIEFVVCEDPESESSSECVTVVCSPKSDTCVVGLGYGAVLGSISSGTLRPDLEVDADDTENVLGKRG